HHAGKGKGRHGRRLVSLGRDRPGGVALSRAFSIFRKSTGTASRPNQAESRRLTNVPNEPLGFAGNHAGGSGISLLVHLWIPLLRREGGLVLLVGWSELLIGASGTARHGDQKLAKASAKAKLVAP